MPHEDFDTVFKCFCRRAELAAFAAQAFVAELAHNSNIHARVRSSRTLASPAPPNGTLSAHDLMQYLVHIGIAPTDSSQWRVEAPTQESEAVHVGSAAPANAPVASKTPIPAAFEPQYPLRIMQAASVQHDPAFLPPAAVMPPPPSAGLEPPAPVQPAHPVSTFAPAANEEEEEEEDIFAVQPVHEFPDGQVPLEMPGGMNFASDFFSKG